MEAQAYVLAKLNMWTGVVGVRILAPLLRDDWLINIWSYWQINCSGCASFRETIFPLSMTSLQRRLARIYVITLYVWCQVFDIFIFCPAEPALCTLFQTYPCHMFLHVAMPPKITKTEERVVVVTRCGIIKLYFLKNLFDHTFVLIRTKKQINLTFEL